MAQKLFSTAAKKQSLPVWDGVAHGALSGYVDRFNGIRIVDDQISASTSINAFRADLVKTVEVYKD